MYALAIANCSVLLALRGLSYGRPEEEKKFVMKKLISGMNGIRSEAAAEAPRGARISLCSEVG